MSEKIQRRMERFGNDRNAMGAGTICLLAAAAIAFFIGAPSTVAQAGPPGGGGPPDLKKILEGPPPILTIDRPQTKTDGTLQVTSSTFGSNGEIPLRNSSYGESISPALTWSAGPKGTRSYALVMEDATFGMDRKGNLHWMAFNIAPEVTSFPEGISQLPAGMIVACCVPHQSRDGKAAYVGPHAPSGAPAFHYSIQIFALDKVLDLTAKASREDLWNAMEGHVLAKGAAVGTFQGPADSKQ